MKTVLILLALCLVAGAAEAHGELYVSSEVFGGPMIVEIAVFGMADAQEPTVTLDGMNLRMIQGTDGHWYAYVADTNNVRVIDGATGIGGTGLDFGIECGPEFLNYSFDPETIVFTSGKTCDSETSPGFLHVLNGARPAASGGSFDTDHWPFIQTFDFADDAEIHVKYGSLQETMLFDGDLADLATLELDRGSYPINSDVRLIIQDGLLNVDPTNEDTWTFDVDGSGEVYSCIFDDAGKITDTNGTVIKVDPGLIYHYGDALRDAGFGKSGMLETSPPEALYVTDNSLQDSTLLPSIAGSLVTIRETAPNSGTFTNTDRLGAANLRAGADFTIAYGISSETAHIKAAPADPSRILLADLRVSDFDGIAGMPAVISGRISNHQGMTQDFAYVVNVTDKNGSVISLGWLAGSILPGQILKPATTWTPAEPGEYTVTALVWESVDSLVALSPPAEITVIVR